MNMHTFKEKYQHYLFPVVASFFAIKFLLILWYFNFEVTDNDQALFWVACHDFSKGIFHTPFIYGTSYGNMLESILAIPFYKLGMPLYYALPWSNGFWMFVSILLFSRQIDRKFPGKQLGVISLSLFFFLGTGFYTVAFAAKGHMAGIFTSLLALHLVLWKRSNIVLAITGLFLGLAMQFNPNALFLVVIVLVFLDNIKELIPIICGGAVSLLYKLYTDWFLNHVDLAELHGQWGIEFTMKDFIYHLEDLDGYLNPVTPVLTTMGFISLLIPVIAIIVFMRQKKWLKSGVSTAYFLLLLFSFGINKISDGTIDELFSYLRFYLSIAFCNAILIVLLVQNIKTLNFTILGFIPLVLLINIRLTVLSSKEAADHAGGWTMSVKKTFISEIKDHTAAILQNIKASRLHNTQILVCDYPLYTELLYVSTLELKNVVIHYHCNQKFYWKKHEIKPGQAYDLIACLNFDKLVELRQKEYPAFFRKESPVPYFLFRNVADPENMIREIL